MVVLSALLVACGSVKRSAAPPPRTTSGTAGVQQLVSPPISVATTETSTTLPTTTTVPPPPPLPAPAPLNPIASPPTAGEGVWHPVGDPLPRGYAMYATELRPGAFRPAAAIAWVDTSAVHLALYAGTSEPYGLWPFQGEVNAQQAVNLMAAFNSGFKIYSYRTGWYQLGRSAVPLQTGAASFVVFANGAATVGDWGRDVGLGPTVAAVRQNLTLLVDSGAVTPQAHVPSEWGAVLGGGVFTWRSGVGVTVGGDLVYVGGPDLDPASLATLLVAAGAYRAMELDINPEWVSFATFTHPAGIGTAGIIGANLLGSMYYRPDHYLQPYFRDFFAVFAP
jgi:hypothetical protein